MLKTKKLPSITSLEHVLDLAFFKTMTIVIKVYQVSKSRQFKLLMSILIIRDKTHKKFGFYINETVLIISNTRKQVLVIRDRSITLYASNQELSSECMLDLEHPMQRSPVGQENNIKLTRRKNHYRWKTLIGDRIFICSNRDMYKQFLVQCFDEIKSLTMDVYLIVQ